MFVRAVIISPYCFRRMFAAFSLCRTQRVPFVLCTYYYMCIIYYICVFGLYLLVFALGDLRNNYKFTKTLLTYNNVATCSRFSS